MSKLSEILRDHTGFADVIAHSKPFRKLDFTENNKELHGRDLSETSVFSTFVFEELLSKNKFTGVGGYGENRIIYRNRKHFQSQESSPRSIHLGTDIWTEAGKSICAPLASEIHSFAFNDHYGDYGPTIILRHELKNVVFYTLYGHLSPDSLSGLFEGKPIVQGEKFASVGHYPENGDWPPHLHFQVISDMGELKGDFPGVCSIEDQERFFSICPDPNLILRISENV